MLEYFLIKGWRPRQPFNRIVRHDHLRLVSSPTFLPASCPRLVSSPTFFPRPRSVYLPTFPSPHPAQGWCPRQPFFTAQGWCPRQPFFPAQGRCPHQLSFPASCPRLVSSPTFFHRPRLVVPPTKLPRIRLAWTPTFHRIVRHDHLRLVSPPTFFPAQGW